MSVRAMCVRVVLVCTGNTCRSPMAAALFEHYARSEPRLDGVEIDVKSAGLQAAEGEPATPAAARAIRARGLSLDDHRARSFDGEMAAADLILTMTERHKAEIILRHPEAAANVYTLKEYAADPSGRDIADPFGGDDEVYKATLREIETAVAKAVERLAKERTQGQ